MIELIAILVYLSHLVALARSRGRSPLWALGGLAMWLLGDFAGWALAGSHGLLATAIGLPITVAGALLFYRVVLDLDPVEHGGPLSRGDNFPCPCCASLQTEDRSGHLACHACGSEFGWSRAATP